MKNYIYQNTLIGKKQLRHLLAWSFTNYDSMQACYLADELKYLGFKYATQAGISISIEDLKVPFVKVSMLEKANQEILNAEKLYLKGKITDVERFQKIIDTWSLTSESLKDQIIYYFKNYDPLNSVYIMAFSGARGNLSQVRQLVGMRGLMSDPSGEIMNLPIKKNFREGLTITDYLMSGYGARKGIVDTALKTANSGYLTRRLIDVAQDILIREKDCLTNHSFLFTKLSKVSTFNYNKILGRVLNKPIREPNTNIIITKTNTQVTPILLNTFKEKNITRFYLRSPLTCNLYRAICQKCYGWDLANENLVELGEAIGILAGQSIGEPGTQLTMRTFHTGGIFTSEARQQILSPLSGIIQYYKLLKTVVLRTNRGEDVLITKNTGSLILIPDKSKDELINIEILRNTILFPKNNQYVSKDTVLGELINRNKQIRTEIKPILSNNPGEIFIPKLRKKINILNNNKLIWLLAGQLYNSPKNSFLNFYPDYKLNSNSYIFRTKIINHYSSSILYSNFKPSLYQRTIQLKNTKYLLSNTTLYRLKTSIKFFNYLLQIENFKYLIQVNKYLNTYNLQVTRNEQAGLLLTNSFRTITGGTIFYDYQSLICPGFKNIKINYLQQNSKFTNYKKFIFYKTIIWLGEEIHKVNCGPNVLLVAHGDVISKNFELVPGIFSKTSGLVLIKQANQVIKTISIKPGLVYEGKKFKQSIRKLYFPGETIFSNVVAQTLSFCEQILSKKTNQLVLIPIELYEFCHSPLFPLSLKIENHFPASFHLRSKVINLYRSNQTIKSKKSVNLLLNLLIFRTNKLSKKNVSIHLEKSLINNIIHFRIKENLCLMNFISAKLKYKKIQSCVLLQANQFISKYMTLGYLEDVTKDSLEIVKFKIKESNSNNKQILLISNTNCLMIPKSQLKNKKLNDFIINTNKVNQSGKIIIENKQFFTIQKGRSYFFPNCAAEDSVSNISLEYKLLSPDRIRSRFQTQRKIGLNYNNILKLSIQKNIEVLSSKKLNLSVKTEFTKIFIKNNGKLYSCLLPQFLKKLTLHSKQQSFKSNLFIRSIDKIRTIFQAQTRTLLFQSSELVKNKYAPFSLKNYQLTLVKFIEQPFTKSTKVVGLHAITEDFFEQEVNSVFCKNSEFIEIGKTLGLLNLEKEITGDIVQGLPRIEEILEARKKNIILKRIPTSQKKGLIVQKTSLDPSFEFKKLGTPIKDNDKINPHKLLKVYFNYYGRIKFFICDKNQTIQSNRLIKNYEGSYKSFKKVQAFILQSVQSVYQSQGVSINDKHLEVIIKQMTTKVLITYEGETPLLRREIIDLYHIKYINNIILSEFKQIAYYVPLLLGISKAALNNPSFISAASFQETTRVLTKAAIEGRIDWLRGLKENIIIGHLIPAGTGAQNYRECFKKCPKQANRIKMPSYQELDNKKTLDKDLNFC